MKLGFIIQILEAPTQRKFISSVRHADSRD